MAIIERRDDWEVRVHAGVDPVTGKQTRISRQVHGSRWKARGSRIRMKNEPFSFPVVCP